MTIKEVADHAIAVWKVKRQEVIEDLREKHQPLNQNQGAIGSKTYCVGCKISNGVLATPWPCDAVKLLRLL